jgi:hypothetical protein
MANWGSLWFRKMAHQKQIVSKMARQKQMVSKMSGKSSVTLQLLAMKKISKHPLQWCQQYKTLWRRGKGLAGNGLWYAEKLWRTLMAVTLVKLAHDNQLCMQKGPKPCIHISQDVIGNKPTRLEERCGINCPSFFMYCIVLLGLFSAIVPLDKGMANKLVTFGFLALCVQSAHHANTYESSC